MKLPVSVNLFISGLMFGSAFIFLMERGSADFPFWLWLGIGGINLAAYLANKEDKEDKDDTSKG